MTARTFTTTVEFLRCPPCGLGREHINVIDTAKTDATHHRILIVNGIAQGLAVLARILPTRGINAVAVEEPGSHGTRTQLQDWGLTTPPVDVDHNGLNVDSLRASGADAVLVTPAHQVPVVEAAP